MRICLDGRAAGPGGTGISAFASSALQALCQHAHQHAILLIANKEMLSRLPLPNHVATLPPQNSPHVWEQLALPSLLEEHEIDVYFSPLFTCPIVRSARSVVTVHDVFPCTHPRLCPPEFLGFWGRRLGPSLRAANHVVTVSNGSREQIVEHLRLPAERISVVQQSVGHRFQPKRAEEVRGVLAAHGLQPGGYVLYVGAIDPRKNLERLLRAFAEVGDSGLSLVLAGRVTFPGYDLGDTPAARKLGARLRLLGYVPDEDLPALYACARCFAFPSLAEGFGRPCIEAMACGVPVVASNKAALPETCGDAALLPEAEDVSAIARALAKACFDEGVRGELIAAGTRRAGEFTSERFAFDLLNALEKALGGPRGAIWPASR